MTIAALLRKDVIRQINDAFGDVRLGDGISLEEAVWMESGTTLEEIMLNRRRSTVDRWQDVPDENIKDYYDVLSFLDEDGFRFYIPAYMTWVVRNYDKSESQTIDWTIYAFTPRDEPRLLEPQMERFSKLTLAEAKTILSFLNYMAVQDDNYADTSSALEAIENYWIKYANV